MKSKMNHSNNKSKPNDAVSHPYLIWIRETQITTEQYKVPGFQEVKVPRFHDNGTGWW